MMEPPSSSSAAPAATTDAAHQRLEAALAQIQPIRDLARNWDVDIASCLEDYLEEIVNHFDLQGEKEVHPHIANDTNFTQAALLLQNSSNVYSRKVEYLYSLVYAALEDLASNSTDASLTRKKRSTDAEVDDFDAFDPDLQFLLLDDVLPTDNTQGGDKINLAHEEEPVTALADELNQTSGMTRLSLGGLSLTHNNNNTTTLGPTSAAARALLGTLFSEGTDTGGGNLRLLNGRCDVGADGALLLPGTALLGGSQSTTGTATTTSMPTNLIQEETDFVHNHNDNDDDDDGGGFHMMDDDDDDPPPEALPDAPTATSVVPVAPNPHVVDDKADPWATLDPHDPGTTKPRPLRIGVTYRLPAGIEQPPSDVVTGAHTRRKRKKTQDNHEASRAPLKTETHRCIATETFKATLARTRQHNTSLDDTSSIQSAGADASTEEIAVRRPHVPLKGLVFGDEFAYIAKKAAKHRAMERRERRKLLVQNPQAVPTQEADELMGYADDDYGGGGYDDDDSVGGGVPFNDDDDNDGPVVGNTGIASLNDAFPTHEDDDARDTSNVEALAFEALCRAHIKAFAKGAEKYATETNLTKRVGEWQQRLGPLLEEEAERPEFDIHEYGQQVIAAIQDEVDENADKLKQNGDASKASPVVDFQAVTRNCEQYEVCRLFLASLSLSNSGNVSFSAQEGTVSQPGSLQLELLVSNVDRPMDSYLAPSARTLVQ